MLLAGTENVLSCTKSKCVLTQKVFRCIFKSVECAYVTTLPKYRITLCYWQVLKMSFLVQDLNVFSFRKYSVVYKRVECAGCDPSKYRVTQSHPPPPITATASH